MIKIRDNEEHKIVEIKIKNNTECVLIVKDKYYNNIKDNIEEMNDIIELHNILLPSAERDVEQTESVSAADNGGRNRKSAIL